MDNLIKSHTMVKERSNLKPLTRNVASNNRFYVTPELVSQGYLDKIRSNFNFWTVGVPEDGRPMAHQLRQQIYDSIFGDLG